MFIGVTTFLQKLSLNETGFLSLSSIFGIHTYFLANNIGKTFVVKRLISNIKFNLNKQNVNDYKNDDNKLILNYQTTQKENKILYNVKPFYVSQRTILFC